MTVLYGIVPDLCPDCGGDGYLSCGKTGHNLEQLEDLVASGETELYPDD